MLPKEKIKEHIRKAQLRKALELFRESLSPKDSVSESDILLLSARNAALEQKERQGSISIENANTERNSISVAILELLNNCQTDTNLSALEQAILNLPLSKEGQLGILQLVNCDRVKPIRQFNKSYKNNTQQPFQFYFIAGCPNEMPSSFAERILYEIMDKQSLELDKSIDYPFEEGIFRRIKVENLPFSEADTNACKKKFKDYILKRFAFLNLDSFEKFIESSVSDLNYSHIATIFRINETQWEGDEGELYEYLQWIIDMFQMTHPKAPTFIFLFVIDIRNLHDPAKVHPSSQKIITELDAFCEKNKTALLREITPVNDMHLEDWLFKLGINNVNYSKSVIDAFVHTLKPEDKLLIDSERHFHMKDVETIQQKVVRAFRGERF